MSSAIRRQIQIIISTSMVLVLVASFLLHAEEKKKPQAFRNYKSTSIPFVIPSTLDLQLLEAFVLMQKANAGESPAQHELGLRYLLGKGFPADTDKAIFWIQKAAERHLPLARYNLGILLMNGRGVRWDPFEAFRQFRAAAEQEIPEALYVMGLEYTENFIVPRNWQKAYQYFKKASELGLEEGGIAIKEMERRGLYKVNAEETVTPDNKQSYNNALQKAPSDTGFCLLFIDFHADTTSTIEDTTLIREAYKWIDTSASIKSMDDMQVAKLDSNAQSMFFSSASAGNPEALCLLGRCYEQGLNVRKDVILAGVYYLRAFRLDSYRAPTLIWRLMHTDEFVRVLELQSARNNPDALYVWSGLTSIGFSKMLNEKQALDLLKQAASMGHVPAIVELGTCYFTGRWVQQDRDKAVELWKKAFSMGSLEANIRLAAANVVGQIHTQKLNTALSTLHDSAKKGSLLSDLTLGYCYEKGISLSRDKGEAYRIFHRCMLRGSETAYHALRNMHDDIRPPDIEFQLSD